MSTNPLRDLLNDDEDEAATPTEHALQYYNPPPQAIPITHGQRRLFETAQRPRHIPTNPPSLMAPTPAPRPAPRRPKMPTHIPPDLGALHFAERVRAMHAEYIANGGNFRMYCKNANISEKVALNELRRQGVSLTRRPTILIPTPERVREIHAEYITSKDALHAVATKNKIGYETLRDAFLDLGLPLRSPTGKQPTVSKKARPQ